MTLFAPMTHEKTARSCRGCRADEQRSVQLRVTDPTPMSTNNTPDQSSAVSRLNDAKWLDDNHITEKIHEHLLERASPTKSWFKSRYVADAIDESAKQVGPALAAMYRSESFPSVVERRSSNGCYIYRVEVS